MVEPRIQYAKTEDEVNIAYSAVMQRIVANDGGEQ